MRRLLLAVAMAGLVSHAHAGDFEVPALGGAGTYAPTPYVPAPPTYMRWSGFYLGGDAGYGSAHIDFSGATESLIAFMLRELALENEQQVSKWQVLGSRDTGGASAGGFVGYNSQWDDLIVGFELTYNKSNFVAQAPADSISRLTTAGGNTYDVTVNGNASMRINDFGTARVRAGYIFNTIMPWAMIGVAAGRADYTRSASVNGIENPGHPLPCGIPAADNCTPFSFSQADAKNNAWIYGWTVGGGVDMMVMPHVFVRAEYEYTNFSPVGGIKPAINTARIGAGFKF